MLNSIVTRAVKLPFDDSTIRSICKDKVTILLYSDLANVKDIAYILRNNPICLLYQTDGKYSGHWVSIVMLDNVIYYFDPYGMGIDYYPNTTTNEHYLSDHLIRSGLPLVTNYVDLQAKKKDINTCGRFSALRCYFSNLTNSQFINMLNEKVALSSPDNIVTMLTLIS